MKMTQAVYFRQENQIHVSDLKRNKEKKEEKSA